MGFYANGVKFECSRQLDVFETEGFKHRVEAAYRTYRWHYRLGVAVFYACLVAVILERTYSILLEGNYPDSGFLVFLFCCLLPPLIGSTQEIILPSSKWSRFLFAVFYLVLFPVQLTTSFFHPDLFSAAAVLMLFLGWIMILLRWFDSRKYLPIVSQGLKSVGRHDVDQYLERDDKGNELIKLEVFADSHLIYSVNDKQADIWEVAEVLEVSENTSAEFLAPWRFAPKGAASSGIKFFQRKMSAEELLELGDIRKGLKKKAIVSLLPSIYLSAVGVRLVENLLNMNIEAELSAAGWIVVLMLGVFFPLRWLHRWKKLGKDFSARQIISIWTTDQYGNKDRLVEEALSESGLLWSQNDRPSYWRVTKVY